MTPIKSFTITVGLWCFGLATCSNALALRTESPPTFHEWNENNFSALNQTLLQFWNALNGRYTMNTTTTDPDGVLRGETGNAILYLPAGGSPQLCLNTDGLTDWDCLVTSE